MQKETQMRDLTPEEMQETVGGIISFILLSTRVDRTGTQYPTESLSMN